MTVGEWAALVAVAAFVLSLFKDFFTGGWSMSSRLATMEASQKMMQASMESMSRTLEQVANMKAENAATQSRLQNIEEDIRDIKHGRGFIRGPQGIEHEYGG